MCLNVYCSNAYSGLDSSTSTQVILLLKQLSQEDRTIVCTIHQPSALVFGLFDHLYAIAEGQCIYTGGTQLLVPFLAELNLVCPETYNPSDYCKYHILYRRLYFAYNYYYYYFIYMFCQLVVYVCACLRM